MNGKGAGYVLLGGPLAGARGVCPSLPAPEDLRVIVCPHPATAAKLIRYEIAPGVTVADRLVFQFQGIYDRESYEIGSRDAGTGNGLLFIG